MHTAMGMSTTEPSLGVWLSCDEASYTDYPMSAIRLVDEHGVEAPVTSRCPPMLTRMAPPTLRGWAFTEFPRRGAEMTLRVYRRKPNGDHELVASFPVSNPVRGTYPE